MYHDDDFIAENGSYVEFHGEDMYEATMSQVFTWILWSFKEITLFWWK